MILKSPTNKSRIRNSTVAAKPLIGKQEWIMTGSGEWVKESPARRCSVPEFVSKLGHGRAAEVYLVRDTMTGELCAEKLFSAKRSFSELGRDVIYWACFQAPFPYHTKESAIRASLYRRKVLLDLTEFWDCMDKCAQN